MKNIRHSLITVNAKWFTVLTTLSTVSIAFSACNKAEAHLIEQPLKRMNAHAAISSVSIVNGAYKIDTAIIRNNVNKEALLTDLGIETLIEKKTKEEIPFFIKSFFDRISIEGKFNMADPGKEWYVGDITDMVLNRVYDTAAVSAKPKQGLPDKQLVYFAIGKNIALLSYYSGGIRISQNMTIIKFKGQQIIDFWFTDNLDLFHGLTGKGAKKIQLIKYLKYISENNGGSC